MQIDFHHATTYVTARLAGFPKSQADIIAYAAQYVDDATNAGTVCFDNKALYKRTNSAHKMVDTRNTKTLNNHLVWIPYHFLPGNAGMPAHQNPDGSFINKIVCKPNSPIALDMVRNAILEHDRPYGLHRLGITMHVYADTWAHQGFAGVIHKINEVEKAEDTGDSDVFSDLSSHLRNFLDDAIPPLGHGRATVFPDMPFLSWTYTNGRGEVIQRNNTDDFCEAASNMCKAMQRYRLKDPDAGVPGLPEQDLGRIRSLFTDLKEEKGSRRHQVWLNAIRDGEFSFGSEETSYTATGQYSWKALALGTSHDLCEHSYKKEFLTSDWKNFHDASLSHRFHIVHDILPQYEICAA